MTSPDHLSFLFPKYQLNAPIYQSDTNMHSMIDVGHWPMWNNGILSFSMQKLTTQFIKIMEVEAKIGWNANSSYFTWAVTTFIIIWSCIDCLMDISHSCSKHVMYENTTQLFRWDYKECMNHKGYIMANSENVMTKDDLIKEVFNHVSKSLLGILSDRKSCVVWKQVWLFQWNYKEWLKHKG